MWVSGVVGSYEIAEAMLRRVGHLTISDSSVWRRAQEWGKRFKEEEDTRREQANALPSRTGVDRGVRETEERKGVSMDGAKVHIVEEGWKELKVGCVFDIEVWPTRDKKTKELVDLAHAVDNTYVAHLGGPEVFGQLMDVTGERDAFGVHTLEYYQRAYDLFHPQGGCELLIASYEGQPLAGVMVFKQGERAGYLYWASNNQHRNLMPTYLVQWEGIRWAKSNGCTVYDMWGAPDQFDESDSMWGVFRFKNGFGGEVIRTLGAWDYPVKPFLYRMYTRLLPALLDRMRTVGDRQTAAAADQNNP